MPSHLGEKKTRNKQSTQTVSYPYQIYKAWATARGQVSADRVVWWRGGVGWVGGLDKAVRRRCGADVVLGGRRRQTDGNNHHHQTCFFLVAVIVTECCTSLVRMFVT